MDNRINTARWQRIRRMQLAREPLCRTCRSLGVITAADEADHIVPRTDGGGHEFSNLQSLCRHHHEAKTRAEQLNRAMPGCDKGGMPLSPKHWWNSGYDAA